MFQAAQDTGHCSLWYTERVTWCWSAALRPTRRRRRTGEASWPSCPSSLFSPSRTWPAPAWAPPRAPPPSPGPVPGRATTWSWSSSSAARWPAVLGSDLTRSSSPPSSPPSSPTNTQRISDPAGSTVRINLRKSSQSWHQSSPLSHPQLSLSGGKYFSDSLSQLLSRSLSSAGNSLPSPASQSQYSDLSNVSQSQYSFCTSPALPEAFHFNPEIGEYSTKNRGRKCRIM